jgi:hypothetical protein
MIIWKRLIVFSMLLVAAQFVFSGCGGCDETTGQGTIGQQADAGGGDVLATCEDADEDGFSAGGACEDEQLDCDDADASVSPGADEMCGDGVDNNCDGQIDEDCDNCTDGQTRECGTDEGICEKGSQQCVEGIWGECEGEVRAVREVCDGVDNDCDGEVDEDPEESLCSDGINCNGVEVCDSGTCVDSEPVDCSHLENPCFDGVCQEKDGSCSQIMLADGTTCDDGNFCTVEGVCAQGSCETAPRDCSGAADQCNEGVCDEDADACVPQPISDGTTCDDGSFCTVTDSCQAGTCEGATRDCSGAGDQCNDGICDESADSCVSQPIADGTTCSDGQYCTVDDVCQAGTCAAGAPRECGASGGSCRTGVCDEQADACDGDPVPDGTSCEDGAFCTVSDACLAGTCAGGATRDCSAAGDQCNDGICDESNRSCEPTPKPTGTTCDDNAFCTTGDVCTSGSCAGSARDCSGAGDQCNSGSCDESADSCVPQPISDGTSCDDATFCTVSDTCTSGACGGSARACAWAGDQCNDGVCDESASSCVAEPVTDGTTCDDGEFCTTSDECTQGSCGGADTDCSAFTDQCNAGMCDEGSDNCYAAPVSDGVTCDDSDPCTVTDECGSGSCGGSPKDCSALDDQCNVGVCDAVTGNCEAVPVSNGTTCDDGSFCTVSDVCSSGTCGGSSRDCSGEDDQCNDGVCDEGSDACVKQPVTNGTTCDDGQFCTDADICSSGTCTGGTATDCSAYTDQCNAGMCDEGSDNCYAAPVSNGTTCDDSDPCTVTDECGSGSCGGSPKDCSALDDQCNVGVCDAVTGNCEAVPVSDGTSCNDADLCTVSDICSSGSCSGSAKDCSGVTDQCNVGVCDPSTGSCDADPVGDGTSCNDNQYCTVSDECSGGVCGGSSRDCSAVATNMCSTGVCDESFDRCVEQYDPTCCDTGTDNDLDGSNQCDDCDDTNGGVYPGASEQCNGIDDDCDGMIDEDFDADGDGYATCTSDPLLRDCDDTNSSVNPGAAEDCGGNGQGNGIDDDCDGYVDEGCNPCTTTDVDGDGYSECDGDCDDGDASIHPGATEQCDGFDNDCNMFTTLNCDVDEPCNFTSGTDVCMDDRLCACIVNGSGSCTGDYRCTTYCNWSETGPIGDGCGTDQTCLYDMLRSSNVHACGVTTETPGSKGGGEACADSTECRSLICDKLCRGPGCNQDYCQDYCGSDDYCGTGAVCRLRRLSDNIDGRCWPAGGPALGTTSVGQSCSSDSSCDHGLCMTDPNDSSNYCTGPCCEDSDCPGGYTCAVAGDQIDTSYVYPDPRGISCTSDTDCTGQGGLCFNNECAWRLVETSPMCVKDVSSQGSRVAGQACAQNSQCESNFCEKNLNVCVSVCCNDSTCPTGLTCDGQTVQTDDDRVSQVRVCMNMSTENIIERQ